MHTRTLRMMGMGLFALAALAIAADIEYVIGQRYVFTGRLEHGMVNDPNFYFEIPCGPGSETSRPLDRHSFTFRLRAVPNGPDIAGTFQTITAGQFVEAEGTYLGVLDAGPGSFTQPTLTAERLTVKPAEPDPRAARFDELYKLRRR